MPLVVLFSLSNATTAESIAVHSYRITSTDRITVALAEKYGRTAVLESQGSGMGWAGLRTLGGCLVSTSLCVKGFVPQFRATIRGRYSGMNLPAERWSGASRAKLKGSSEFPQFYSDDMLSVHGTAEPSTTDLGGRPTDALTDTREHRDYASFYKMAPGDLRDTFVKGLRLAGLVNENRESALIEHVVVPGEAAPQDPAALMALHQSLMRGELGSRRASFQDERAVGDEVNHQREGDVASLWGQNVDDFKAAAVEAARMAPPKTSIPPNPFALYTDQELGFVWAAHSGLVAPAVDPSASCREGRPEFKSIDLELPSELGGLHEHIRRIVEGNEEPKLSDFSAPSIGFSG